MPSEQTAVAHGLVVLQVASVHGIKASEQKGLISCCAACIHTCACQASSRDAVEGGANHSTTVARDRDRKHQVFLVFHQHCCCREFVSAESIEPNRDSAATRRIEVLEKREFFAWAHVLTGHRGDDLIALCIDSNMCGQKLSNRLDNLFEALLSGQLVRCFGSFAQVMQCRRCTTFDTMLSVQRSFCTWWPGAAPCQVRVACFSPHMDDSVAQVEKRIEFNPKFENARNEGDKLKCLCSCVVIHPTRA